MITIIENVAKEDNQELLLKYICTQELPLYYNECTSRSFGILKSTEVEFPQFTHVFVNDGVITSNHFSLIADICKNIHDEISKTYGKKIYLKRAKLNVTSRQEIGADKHYCFHSDDTHEGFTAIYYINDSDGDTLFYKDGAIAERVTPRKGMAVYFDNKLNHAGTPSRIAQARFLLNINWVTRLSDIRT